MTTGELVGCPHCGRPIAYSRELAGQIIGCPHCGGKLQMPAASPGRSAAVPPPPFAPALPSRSMSFEPPETSAPSKPEKEPWYYGFLAGYANFFLWIAILSFLTLGIMFGYTVLKPFGSALIQEQGVRGWVLAGLIWLGYVLLLFAQLLGTIFFVALILLGVDAGRNLRELRIRAKKE